MAETPGMDGGGDDIVAAEYVLGVLPASERQAAQSRIDSEPSFAQTVDRWEVHFAPLGAAYAAVDPPASVKSAIDRRLFAAARVPGREAAGRAGIWGSLAFWRGLAAAAFAALALVIVIPYVAPPAPVASRLVASLAAAGSDVHYMAMYDAATGEVSLSHVSGERAPGQDFELWMIEGSAAPVSMGIIPQGGTVRMIMPQAAREHLTSGDVLAVSVEPAGGSPTGLPTGPVVAVGDLRSI